MAGKINLDQYNALNTELAKYNKSLLNNNVSDSQFKSILNMYDSADQSVRDALQYNSDQMTSKGLTDDFSVRSLNSILEYKNRATKQNKSLNQGQGGAASILGGSVN